MIKQEKWERELQEKHDREMREYYEKEQEKINKHYEEVENALREIREIDHERHEYYYHSQRGFGNEYTVYSIPASLSENARKKLLPDRAERISAKRAGQLSSPDNLGNFAGITVCPCYCCEIAKRNRARFRYDPIFKRHSVWPNENDDYEISARF